MKDQAETQARTETRSWIQDGAIWFMVLISVGMIAEGVLDHDFEMASRGLGVLTLMLWLRSNMWFAREDILRTSLFAEGNFRRLELLLLSILLLLLPNWVELS